MDYKNRKDMKKIIVAITMVLAIQVAVTSCQREDVVQCQTKTPEEENEEPPYTIGDWDDGGTIYTKPDSVRDATHEDSIRFGLI